jgi:hypothetical protein
MQKILDVVWFVAICIHVYHLILTLILLTPFILRIDNVKTHLNHRMLKRTPPDLASIEQCLNKIASGSSVRSCCKEFGLAKSTVLLHQKAQNESPLLSIGRQPYLPQALSKEISATAKDAAQNGFGLSKKELKVFVHHVVQSRWNNVDQVGEHLRKYCRFKDGNVSDEWIEKFMSDNHLTLRKPSSMERCRAKAAADPFVVYEFYDLVRKEMQRLEISDKPSHIFNLDETSFCVDPTRGKVVAEVNSHVHRINSGTGRQNFSVMACICADGTYQPPLVIFTGQHLYSLWRGKHPLQGTTYAVSSNGWMDARIFESWFNIFITKVPHRPLILIYDGHKSHLGLTLIQKAREESISIIKLPSHTTDRLQPLDVSCFRPLKMAWDERLVAYQRKNGFEPLKRAEFVDLLCEVWPEKLSSSTIKSGFRKTGVFPLDSSQFPRTAFQPSKLKAYEEEHTEQETVLVTNSCDIRPKNSQHDQQISTGESEYELMRLKDSMMKLSTQMANYLNARSPMSQPNASSSSDLTNHDHPEASSMTTSDVFFSKFSPSRNVQADISIKRKRIHQSAAVITSDDYLEAINNLSAAKLPKLKQKVPHYIVNESGDDTDNDSAMQMPPPLPKPEKRMTSPAASKCLKKIVNASRGKPKRIAIQSRDETCLYCGDTYSNSRAREMWLRCRVCQNWAHNECADVSPSFVDFTCELCL